MMKYVVDIHHQFFFHWEIQVVQSGEVQIDVLSNR